MKFKYLCILLISAPLFSFAGGSPKDVVEKYCEYDFNGARLISSGASNYRHLIDYEEEPGWDSVISVMGYKVGDEKISGNTAIVIVNYDIIQAFPAPLVNISQYQTVEVELLLQEGNWKVSKYIDYPRVGNELLCDNWGFCAK